jgi:hypothetical protein
VPKPHAEWILNFADGSGNRYTIASDAADANAHLVYEPITPEQSSSGTYSGGSPVDRQISAENTSELCDVLRRCRMIPPNTARREVWALVRSARKTPRAKHAF